MKNGSKLNSRSSNLAKRRKLNKGDTVSIKTALNLDSGNRICIKIEDTGEGIPAEILSKVMDPFFTTKPVGKGSGLGLPITRRIVEEHGGEFLFPSPLQTELRNKLFKKAIL